METDTLRRDDMSPPAPPAKKTVLRVRWAIINAYGTAHASQRLYTAAQAKRYVRLAARFGITVHARRFGHVAVTA